MGRPLLSTVLESSRSSFRHYGLILKCSTMLQRLVNYQISFLETRCKRDWRALCFRTLLLIKYLFSQLLKPFRPITASHTHRMKHWWHTQRLRWHNTWHRWHLTIQHPAFIYSLLVCGKAPISIISRWTSFFLGLDVRWRCKINCFPSCLLIAVILLHSADVIGFCGGYAISAQDLSLC